MIWRRLRFVALLTGLLGYAIDLVFNHGMPFFLQRGLALGAVGLAVFTWFEGRWIWQVIGVALAMPITTFLIWFPFWAGKDQELEFGFVTALALLIAPWTALAALLRQKDAFARDLSAEMERQALDARLRLLQAQIAPHFLFNTLANVQALVEAGSPHAAGVLRSLVAYLRAAVPRLDERAVTIAQELDLVQAYLELMHTRMPDRLDYSVQAEEEALSLRCPPTTLLTLVENAVRHGIDPSESGGRIDISVERRDGRCLIRVEDSGVGLGNGATAGAGTGLAALRERLRLSFGGDASLRLGEREPRGVRAEIDFPAEPA